MSIRCDRHKRFECPECPAYCTSPLELAFDRLDNAARDRAGAVQTEHRAVSAHELRCAALSYAAAELESRFGADRIPWGHVGEEPSAFDAIEHLRTKALSK